MTKFTKKLRNLIMETPIDSEYVTKGLPPPPNISMKTIPMAGLLVDVYGLEELPPSSTPTTALWLLHPRTRTRARMRDIACRVLHAYHQTPSSKQRGLIALAFDMPNHGTRSVSDKANGAWRQGNEEHAIDMAGMVKGGRADMSGLIDLVGGYVGRRVDAHVCLGWSLGGHAAWQAWIGEGRVDAVAVVVGCPDFMGLMSDRAKKSKLDCGDSLIGSKYFPDDLVNTCKTYDPRGILIGTSSVPSAPLSDEDRTRLRQTLASRGCIKGKKILLMSGAEDKLVPHVNSAPMIKVLQDVGGVELEDKVYEGVGHSFSGDMVHDAVRFLVKAVEEGPREKARM